MNSLIKTSSFSSSLIFLIFTNNELFKMNYLINNCQFDNNSSDFNIFNLSMNVSPTDGKRKGAPIEHLSKQVRYEENTNVLKYSATNKRGDLRKSDLEVQELKSKFNNANLKFVSLFKILIDSQLIENKKYFKYLTKVNDIIDNLVLKKIFLSLSEFQDVPDTILQNIVKRVKKLVDQINKDIDIPVQILSKELYFLLLKISKTVENFKDSLVKIKTKSPDSQQPSNPELPFTQLYSLNSSSYIERLSRLNHILQFINKSLQNCLICNHLIWFDEIDKYNNVNFLELIVND